MPVIPFPATLQGKLNEQGFSHSIGDTTIRSDVGVGPAKVRRIYTRSVDSVSGSINLTTSEYSVFYYFYNTSLNGGVNQFSYAHPITGVSTNFRFKSPPGIRSIGGGNFSVSMDWEILP